MQQNNTGKIEIKFRNKGNSIQFGFNYTDYESLNPHSKVMFIMFFIYKLFFHFESENIYAYYIYTEYY